MPIYESKLVNLIEGVNVFSMTDLKASLTPGDAKLIVDMAKFLLCVNNSGKKTIAKAIEACLKKI